MISGDLLIRNGTVVDGSGAPARQGDVAIRGGRIVDPSAAKPGCPVIDAGGQVVAPGFIDIHTHYDAQVMWDPMATCSPWHGVTTVVMGNCGYTLAPCLPRDREYIMQMFARVEGMNANALHHGLDWRWESFDEYLDRVSDAGPGINIGTMVGHSAVRRFVMGEEANTRQADADEVQRMKALVREAISAGAFGFTTSFQRNHMGWDGQPVPSLLATYEEAVELASALSEFPGVGSTEIITRTATQGETFEDADRDLLISLARRTGRPVNWNELSQNPERGDVWKTQLAFMEQAHREGAPVYAVSRCQSLDVTFNLAQADFFDRWPTWQSVLSRPIPEAMEALKTDQARAAMRQEAEAGDATLPDYRRFDRMVVLRSKTGRHAASEGQTLGALSEQQGKSPFDVLADIALDEELGTELAFRGVRNGDPKVVAEIVSSPYSLAGISDAGAHTNRLSGSYYSTYLLSHWVRETGVLSLEDAVRRLTSMQASVYGISDRGLLREGMAGDVTVFDLEALDWLPAERLDDFPGGESRLANRAQGYRAVIVDGEAIYEDGSDTGRRPGRVIRSSEYRHTRQ